MPYMDWKDQPRMPKAVGPIGALEMPDARLRMSLTLAQERLAELVPALRELFGEEALDAKGAAVTRHAELRLDLPDNWIVFWKKREGESRLLLAHPQDGEWVATAALTFEHASALLRALESLEPGQSVHLSELACAGGASAISNLELTLTRE